MKRDLVLLIVILLAGLGLRVAFFNGVNWDDDLDYVARAYRVLSRQSFIYTDNNGFRIGTYYPIAVFYALFGVNNISCGLYALTVSMLGLLAIFHLGKVLFGKEIGLIATCLLAFYPLDIELASRPMPDGLLSGFSLFAAYFLLKADNVNLVTPRLELQCSWQYFISGLLVGWCTVINMSAVVFVFFLVLYFFVSCFIFFRIQCTSSEATKKILKLVIYRYVLIVAGFLVVGVLEGTAYFVATGDFLFKYRHTLEHYAGQHGFNKDPGLYPRIMFHMSSWFEFSYQGRERSYYGFYYYALLLALLYCVVKLRISMIPVITWLLAVFGYLQWGSMSLTEYVPFHRLPRHLSLVTPPMILCLAMFLGGIQPARLRRWVTALILGPLCVSSVYFSYYRHESLADSVLPQAEIHRFLPLLKPRHVFAVSSTLAYQKFLERFQPPGWHYLQLQDAMNLRLDDSYAIIGEYRNWEDRVGHVMADLQRPPPNWLLVRTLSIAGKGNRPPYDVHIFRLLPRTIEPLAIESEDTMLAHVNQKFPGALGGRSKIVLAWECLELDGIDELLLQEGTLTLRHLEYNYPVGIRYKVFHPLVRKKDIRLRVLKEEGRGGVEVTQLPTEANDFTLHLRLDDGPYASFDYYRFFVVMDE